MSVATDDVREIFARIEHGMACCREAKVLKETIEHLTWKVGVGLIEKCRHCGTDRGNEHDGTCPAVGIE